MNDSSNQQHPFEPGKDELPSKPQYNFDFDRRKFFKLFGGGLAVGALGGRLDIMSCLAPLGPVYQAGTLSGNPLAMAAGLATLSLISQPGFYGKLENKTRALTE